MREKWARQAHPAFSDTYPEHKDPLLIMNIFTNSEVGVKRRTILATAAWAAPVIVASASTPALAASVVTGALSFDKTVYTPLACGSLTPTVFLRNGVAGVSGQLVTVTLSGGLTWAAGGSAPKVLGPTTAQGSVVLPPIAVPIGAGDYTITATGQGEILPATARVNVTVGGNAYFTGAVDGWAPMVAVRDAGGTAVVAEHVFVGTDYSWVITPTGDVYMGKYDKTANAGIVSYQMSLGVLPAKVWQYAVVDGLAAGVLGVDGNGYILDVGKKTMTRITGLPANARVAYVYKGKSETYVFCEDGSIYSANAAGVASPSVSLGSPIDQVWQYPQQQGGAFGVLGRDGSVFMVWAYYDKYSVVTGLPANDPAKWVFVGANSGQAMVITAGGQVINVDFNSGKVLKVLVNLPSKPVKAFQMPIQDADWAGIVCENGAGYVVSSDGKFGTIVTGYADAIDYVFIGQNRVMVVDVAGRISQSDRSNFTGTIATTFSAQLPGRAVKAVQYPAVWGQNAGIMVAPQGTC